jgi:hypothetical protein
VTDEKYVEEAFEKTVRRVRLHIVVIVPLEEMLGF